MLRAALPERSLDKLQAAVPGKGRVLSQYEDAADYYYKKGERTGLLRERFAFVAAYTSESGRKAAAVIKNLKYSPFTAAGEHFHVVDAAPLIYGEIAANKLTPAGAANRFRSVRNTVTGNAA